MGLLAPLLTRLALTFALTVVVRLATGRGSLGVGVGYAAGHALTRGGWPPLPPLDAMDWLPYLALAAGFGWPGRVGLTALSLGVLLGPRIQGGWTAWGASARLAGFAVAWLSAWAIADGGGGAALVLVAGGAAVVLGLSGSVVLGSLGAVAASAIMAAGVVGRLDRGAVGAAVTVLAGLLTVGLVYGEVPPASALLLAAAPAGGWVDALGALARWRFPLRLAAVGMVVAGAVGVAAWASPGD